MAGTATATIKANGRQQQQTTGDSSERHEKRPEPGDSATLMVPQRPLPAAADQMPTDLRRESQHHHLYSSPRTMTAMAVKNPKHGNNGNSGKGGGVGGRRKVFSKGSLDVHVEVDPTGRYTRSSQVLGKGSSKIVYKGFDRFQGIEVAWNQVKIPGHLTPEIRDRIFKEVEVLKRLRHKNIMKFYTSWIDEHQHTLNFITEYFHPGPLRRHRHAHKCLPRKVLKRWAWQILQGLVYLHGHEPPIIHRDLKCDNIFIHGVTGEVKIGDLGLAKLMEEGLSTCQSVLGTPEFMAPELYHGMYNEKVDIFAYGMCLLELVTMQFPYMECKSRAQIFRHVSMGIQPRALMKITDDETREFIELCINHFHERRPYARQLLKHSFFDDVRSGNPSPPVKPPHHHFEVEGPKKTKEEVVEGPKKFKIRPREMNGTKLKLELSIVSPGSTKVFMFHFDMDSDTVDAVSLELQDEFDLSKEEVVDFSNLLRAEVEHRIMEERRDTVQDIKDALGQLGDIPNGAWGSDVLSSAFGKTEEDIILEIEDNFVAKHIVKKPVMDTFEGVNLEHHYNPHETWPAPEFQGARKNKKFTVLESEPQAPPTPLCSGRAPDGINALAPLPPLPPSRNGNKLQDEKYADVDEKSTDVDEKIMAEDKLEVETDGDVELVPYWVAGKNPGNGTVFLQRMDRENSKILEVSGHVADSVMSTDLADIHAKHPDEKTSVVYMRVAKAGTPSPVSENIEHSPVTRGEGIIEHGASLKVHHGEGPPRLVQSFREKADASCLPTSWRPNSSFYDRVVSGCKAWCLCQSGQVSLQKSRFKKTKSFINFVGRKALPSGADRGF